MSWQIIITLIAAITTFLVTVVGGSIAFLVFIKPNYRFKNAEAKIEETNADLAELDLYKNWKSELNKAEKIHEEYTNRLKKKNRSEIEEKEKAEEASKIFQQKVYLEKKKLSRVLEAIKRLETRQGYAFWICNKNGDLIDVNPQWSTLFGLTLQQARGKYWQKVVENIDILRMSEKGEIDKMNFDDKHEPVFIVTNQMTKQKLKVKSIYVNVFLEEEFILSFGICYEMK